MTFDRRKGVGASEAAVALGLSRWKSPYDLWMLKTGRIEEEIIGNQAMELGKLHERTIQEFWCRENGIEQSYLQEVKTPIPHPKCPFMFATPDRMWSNYDLVEYKSTARKQDWGTPRTDEVPQDYFVQVQCQMACTGYNRTFVVVMFNGNEIAEYIVDRHNELVQSIEDKLADFWQLVITDTPPTPDFACKSVQDNLSKMRILEDEIQAGTDLEVAVKQWQLFRKNRLLCEKEENKLRASILGMTDGARSIHLSDGSSVERKHISYTKPAVEAKDISYVTLTYKESK